MKKILLIVFAAGLFPAAAIAQDSAPEQKSSLDQKVRFGLRVTGQPSWLVSNDKNNIPSGSHFGFGFGLNVEFIITKSAAFLTGIGGDFEGGRYTFKYLPTEGYVVRYHMNQSSEFIDPKNRSISETGTTVYVLKERQVKTTHVTIPLVLKLGTQEYTGYRFFGLFGGELGIRVNNEANDTYHETRKYSDPDNFTVVSTNETQTEINLREETTLIPLRLGLHAGLGMEFRLGGTTSAFISASFFRSFVNLFKKESEYAYFDTDGSQPLFIKQNLKQAAIRINVGLMF